MNLGRPHVEIEEFVVSLAYASPEPRAVVIVNGDAAVTDAAVKDSWRLHNKAGRALLA
jgi:hypothetical protein